MEGAAVAALDMSVKHGQTWDAARANFENGVAQARAKFPAYVRGVAWSDDRTSAHLTGPGFDVVLSVDADSVHARGTVPFFVRMLEGPIRRFVEESLGPPA
jgi:hypothetical protein